MSLPIFTTVAELRAALRPHRVGKIAFVPTMGALHAGHLELVRRAAAEADHVVVSIFVNPAQFAPNEDFAAYPRNLSRDAELIASVQATNLSIFAPDVAEIYPAPTRTHIELGDIAARFEGAARPTHFAGVALVVSKLFHMAQPDLAIFGEKDFQQLQVIRQLVRDLSFPIDIIGAPIVREASGLALSSRNAYLTDEQRGTIAPRLYAALQSAAASIRAGKDVTRTTQEYTTQLLAAGFSAVDYLAYVDAETLAPLAGRSVRSARLLAAARLGGVRLLDNVAVD